MEKKIELLAILTVGILLSNVCLAQNSPTVGPPQTMQEVKSVLWKAVKFFPETITKVMGETFDWLKNIWNSYFYPFFHQIWQKIEPIFSSEIDRRTPVIKEEFKKETEEMKNELPSLSDSARSVWEKVKNFFKF